MNTYIFVYMYIYIYIHKYVPEIQYHHDQTPQEEGGRPKEKNK
jgi:hypothetical protein